MTGFESMSEAVSEPAELVLRPRRNWLPWVAAGVWGLALAAVMLRIGLGRVPGVGSVAASWALIDFHSSMYYPVRALLEGGNPHDASWFMARYPVQDGYGPFLPINFLLHLPLGLLPVELAEKTYFGLSVLFAAGLAFLALRLGGFRTNAALVALVTGFILLSRPGHWTLLLGQPAILLACFCYLTLMHTRSRPVLAGVALSLAAYKPTFGVPLAMILLAAGHVRTVVLGAAIGLAVNLPLYWVLASRVGGFRAFVENVVWNYREWHSRPKAASWSNFYLVDADGLISRFLGQSIGVEVVLLLLVGITVGTGLLIRRLDWNRQEDRDLAVAIACTATLLSVHHLGYDMVLLAAPMVVLALRGLPSFAPSALRWVFLALYLIPALNWLATRSVLGSWSGSRASWVAIASISGLCLLGLFVGYVALALAHISRSRPLESAAAARLPA